MLSFAVVALKFEAELTHTFSALSRLDFVRLLAFGGSLGAHLLVELFLSTLALLLEAFINVDCSTLRDVTSVGVTLGVRSIIVVDVEFAQLAKLEAATGK